jgi:hypothetical protein
MDYISTLKDSVDTSINMKLFKNRKDASFAHIFRAVRILNATFYKKNSL